LDNTSYGRIIEFTGSLNLTNGQEIQILHDDGVALEIDGTPLAGFSNGANVPLLEYVTRVRLARIRFVCSMPTRPQVASVTARGCCSFPSCFDKSAWFALSARMMWLLPNGRSLFR
jgi:hypothetical protein